MDPNNNSDTGGTGKANTFTDDAALSALEAEAVEAAAPPRAPAPAQARDPETYMSEAGMLIGMGLQILAVKLGVTLPAEVKEEGAKKLAAVLAKHNGVMPDWYKRYEEEFALGIWCAGVAWRCYEESQKRKAAVTAAPDGGGDAKAQ